ncbi:hypothetical protein [Allorhodopirellula heiligendammensis]|uniref:Glycosyltransferase RgtA/B/C/D-like domain-containing protein n=1 Tax=Allorhodopirellula heiligendammensis TaxID=2714739 RepID=A0A5C6C0W6_9BACT|nr:hypothetical protein [Allorhodopirellula heiligendammensis]TWU16489.1 hypothetical protein Poly21_36940 [Allorhodopirellula heiligendammensis]
MIRLAAIAGVFVIAVAVRWPSCGESFWVDELHTAWCIADSLDQVADRAAIGNQQPTYFHALYLWQFCLPASVIALYGTEAALRASSVLLTAASAAWLVAIVSGQPKHRQTSGRVPTVMLIGGIAAGLGLALEHNAIFFGTELRPYSAIIFLTTAALALANRLSQVNATSLDATAPAMRFRDVVPRVALHAIVLLSADIHITSLIVLAPQMMIFAISDVWRLRAVPHRRRVILLTHGVVGLAWIAWATVWSNSHADLWESRDQWNFFATADGWHDIWNMWPWGPLAAMPVAGWAMGRQRRGGAMRPPNGQHNVTTATLILAGVIASTLACYVLTAHAGIPLWHRRYLIAALPLLCAAMGWFIGAIDTSFHWRTALFAVGLSIACIGLLMYQQGTFATWRRGEFRVARRSENWKSAIELVRKLAVDGDRVWIDAGLIEQNGLPTLVADPQTEEYLRYVASGPYRLGERVQGVGIGRDAISSWLASAVADSVDPPRYLITRRRSRRMVELPAGITGYRFGSVTVLLRQ